MNQNTIITPFVRFRKAESTTFSWEWILTLVIILLVMVLIIVFAKNKVGADSFAMIFKNSFWG